MLYIFDGYILDPSLQILSLGETRIQLRPKPFQVLMYLVEHCGRVVPKDELMQQVWAGQSVRQTTVESCIRSVRQVLGESGQTQRLIQTVAGHGYRFAGEVVCQEDDEAETEPTDRPCPVCESDNPVDAKFCMSCGSRLPAVCLHCGSHYMPPANFCAQCGMPLSDSQSTVETSEDDVSSRQDTAERRQLTALFCDVVESTPLSEKIGLEDFHEVLRAYQDVCTDVMARCDGYIAQYLGDGLLGYFGYPLAHEDDAQRAVQAGLSILEALDELNGQFEQQFGMRLAVRIGLHTRLVIIGDEGRREPLAIGDTLHIAARIQTMAAPNTVVMSAVTARLVQGYFTCDALGAHALRGVSTPMLLYRAVQASGAHSRLEVAVHVGLTPLVGREVEVKFLRERWLQVTQGIGHAVLLSGESGIGKSRLVHVLQDYSDADSAVTLQGRCSQYRQHSALYPVIDILQRLLAFHVDDGTQTKLRKLEAALKPSALPEQPFLSLLAELLSLEPEAERHPMPPQQKRQQTLEAIVTLVLELAESQPVLLVVEDLHWVDPSTLEWLSLLLDQIAGSTVFILLTGRSYFQNPWMQSSHVTQLTLTRLAGEQVEQMMTHLAGGKPLPDEVLQPLVPKTDGVPLFVEELTRTLLETNLLREGETQYELAAPLPDLAIPATLHDSLMSRLDRLGKAKIIVQLGATAGRQFSYQLIQAVLQWEEDELQVELQRLIEAEFLYPYGLPPHTTYIFKHTMQQEIAYQALSRQMRQDYHARIAEALEHLFPDLVALQPELAAHHYTEAGLMVEAIPFWQQAGQRAIDRSANMEAIAHLSKGLDLLEQMPPSPERIQQELTLQLALGAPLLMTKGHSAPEVKSAYARAHALCRQAGESPRLFSVMMGLWRFYYARTELRTALELSEQCYTLAEDLADSVFLHESHLAIGSTLFILGDYTAARRHLEQGLALYDREQSRARGFSSGNDPGVVCLTRLAWSLWMLGYPDQALARMDEALALAESLAHPYSMGLALQFGAVLHQFRREAEQVQIKAEATLELAEAQGFVYWLGGAKCMRGWARAALGEVEAGIAELREGLSSWLEMGATLGQTHLFLRLAEAYHQGGQLQASLGVVDDTIKMVDDTEECHYESELYRFKGELLHQLSPFHPEAEPALLRALDLARSRLAKSLELRAAMSLCRYWRAQGKPTEAERILTPVFNWFTEGFETPDLRQAKALLEL